MPSELCLRSGSVFYSKWKVETKLLRCLGQRPTRRSRNSFSRPCCSLPTRRHGPRIEAGHVHNTATGWAALEHSCHSTPKLEYPPLKRKKKKIFEQIWATPPLIPFLKFHGPVTSSAMKAKVRVRCFCISRLASHVGVCSSRRAQPFSPSQLNRTAPPFRD